MPKKQSFDIDLLQEAAARLPADRATKAYSLIDWHNRKGWLTERQKSFAAALIKQSAHKDKIRAARPLFLYAIGDGNSVKLGYSKTPERRLKEMQTGHPVRLELLWTLMVGTTKAEAEMAERKLHRFCREFHRRGEWFTMSAMGAVRKFEVKPNKAERRAMRRQLEGEREIITAAQERLG